MARIATKSARGILSICCIKQYAISCDYGKRESELYRQYLTDAAVRPLTVGRCEVDARYMIHALADHRGCEGALSLKIWEDT